MSNGKHVLVTGASGFIGGKLVHALVALGYQVTALTRDPARSLASLPAAVSSVTLDQIPSGEQYDAVVNLAGARIAPIPWTAKRRHLLRQSRITFTQRLIDKITPPMTWIQASAVGYYGTNRSSASMVESDPAGNDFAAQLCHDWEATVEPLRSAGTRICTLRMGVVLGHGGALPGLLLPIRLGLGGPLGDGQQPFPWIHIDDVIKLTLACLASDDFQGVYNAVAPDPHTQSTFARTASQLLHRPCWFPTPSFAFAMLGDVAALFLEGKQVTPQRLSNLLWQWRHPTLHSALAQLIQTSR